MRPFAYLNKKGDIMRNKDFEDLIMLGIFIGCIFVGLTLLGAMP
jgi:hypothetical protein|tara:strand:- start:520 stop:651 length:132 start_codon:yes stop_codon:yes gene_type:complete